jgi:hypothetical protein
VNVSAKDDALILAAAEMATEFSRAAALLRRRIAALGGTEAARLRLEPIAEACERDAADFRFRATELRALVTVRDYLDGLL